jgi:hypothetical protein
MEFGINLDGGDPESAKTSNGQVPEAAAGLRQPKLRPKHRYEVHRYSSDLLW